MSIKKFSAPAFKTAQLICTLFFCCALPIHAAQKESPKMETAPVSFYDFTVKSIDGQDVALKQYAGKVLLIVNTASRCGFTPQYKGLELLQKKYGPQGLVVLGFPSNDFGGQEPGSNEQIKSFCELNFQVSFPLFAKGAVSGKDIQPLYKYLTQDANPKFSGKILWNFEKFIIDRNGNLIERFRSITGPDSNKINKTLEAALASK